MSEGSNHPTAGQLLDSPDAFRPALLNGTVTSVAPVVVDAGTRTWVFVKVTVDDGLVGVGECTLEWRTDVVVAALFELAPMLVGEKAARIAHHFQRMWRSRAFRGGPGEFSAISGIEQALWDVKGKECGQPVFELLGGACRESVALYANGVFEGTPEETAASAAEICRTGFDSIKLGCVGRSAHVDGGAVIRHAVDVFDAVRDAVGPDVRIAIDAAMRLSPAMAIRLARALESRDVWFLEEPCRMDHPDALTAVARATSVPIAAGERWLSRAAFVNPLRDRAIALAQPDVAHCGGILEGRFIAAMAEAHDIGFAPHNPLSPVNTLASAHVAITCPNFVALEYKIAPDAPWRDDLLSSRLDIRDGRLYLSRAPGLGSELDEDAVRGHPRRPIEPPDERLLDGSVAER